MNPTTAAFLFSRARSVDGEFSKEGATSPDIMAKAYGPMRQRLGGSGLVAKIRNKASVKNGIVAAEEVGLSRKLTPVEFAKLRMFAREQAERLPEFASEIVGYKNPPPEPEKPDNTLRNIGILGAVAGTAGAAYGVHHLVKQAKRLRNVAIGLGVAGAGYGAVRLAQDAKHYRDTNALAASKEKQGAPARKISK